MTPADVLNRVEAIRAMQGDDEAAHSAERALHSDVLRAIAAGTHAPGTAHLLAEAALMASTIEFERWCA